MLTFAHLSLAQVCNIFAAGIAIVGRMWRRYKLVILAALGWSFVGVLTKSIRYDPLPMTSIRSCPYIPLGLLLIARTLFRRQEVTQKKSWAILDSLAMACRHVYFSRDGIHWLCAFCSCGSLICMTLAFLNSAGGFATFVNSGSLFLVLLLSGPVLDHWPTRKEAAIVCLGFIGVCVLAYAGWSRGELSGILWGATSAGCITVALLAQKKRSRGNRGTEALESWTLASTITALGFAPWMLWTTPPQIPDLLLIGVLGIFATFIPDVSYVRAISGPTGVPLLHAMVVSRISPILTPVWVCWKLGEMPSKWSFVGAAIVIVAVFLLAAVQKDDSATEQKLRVSKRGTSQQRKQ